METEMSKEKLEFERQKLEFEKQKFEFTKNKTNSSSNSKGTLNIIGLILSLAILSSAFLPWITSSENINVNGFGQHYNSNASASISNPTASIFGIICLVLILVRFNYSWVGGVLALLYVASILFICLFLCLILPYVYDINPAVFIIKILLFCTVVSFPVLLTIQKKSA
jgi:hypothetical protein